MAADRQVVPTRSRFQRRKYLLQLIQMQREIAEVAGYYRDNGAESRAAMLDEVREAIDPVIKELGFYWQYWGQ